MHDCMHLPWTSLPDEIQAERIWASVDDLSFRNIRI